MTPADLARADFLPQHIAAQLLTETADDVFTRKHAALWRALNTLALSGGFVVPKCQFFRDEV